VSLGLVGVDNLVEDTVLAHKRTHLFEPIFYLSNGVR
jgi:hypothetical protein